MASSRFARLRNFQSNDFWAMVFARPATILLLWPLADRAWVTPNRITAVGFIVRVVGAVLLYQASGSGALWTAVALLNLGLVLDNMDGTLARYRRCGTPIGYYVDKALDQVAYLLLFLAIGARTYEHTHHPLDLAMPLLAYSGIAIAGYCKWVADKVLADLKLREHVRQGTLEAFARGVTHIDGGQPPPQRTAAQWLGWFGQALKSLIYFNEVDISLWLLIALAVGRPELFTRYVSAMYALASLVVPVYFFVKIAKVTPSLGGTGDGPSAAR